MRPLPVGKEEKKGKRMEGQKKRKEKSKEIDDPIWINVTATI